MEDRETLLMMLEAMKLKARFLEIACDAAKACDTDYYLKIVTEMARDTAADIDVRFSTEKVVE